MYIMGETVKQKKFFKNKLTLAAWVFVWSVSIVMLTVAYYMPDILIAGPR